MPPAATTLMAASLGPLPQIVTIPPQGAPLDPVTDHSTRNPDSGGELTQSYRPHGGDVDGKPQVDPGTGPTRTALQVLGMWVPNPTAPEGNIGIKAEFAGPSAATPSGVALANGDPQRGNSWRLSPEPWDGAMVTPVHGAEGGVA